MSTRPSFIFRMRALLVGPAFSFRQAVGGEASIALVAAPMKTVTVADLVLMAMSGLGLAAMEFPAPTKTSAIVTVVSESAHKMRIT